MVICDGGREKSPGPVVVAYAGQASGLIVPTIGEKVSVSDRVTDAEAGAQATVSVNGLDVLCILRADFVRI